MASALENYMRELCDTNRPLAFSKLVNLSDLSREELEIFRREWRGIDVARRRQIVERMVELAWDNLELDFDAIYRFCINDADSEVKVKAIEGLAECEDHSLIEPLISLLLGDLEHSVRAAAAAALGTFALLDEFGELTASDAEKVEKALFSAFNNNKEEMDVRRRALEAISTLSRPQVEELIRQAYQSDSLDLKASALCAMGLNCNPAWLSTILQELGSPNPRLRFESARACGELELEETVPKLIELIHDSDFEVQMSAIESLGKIGGNRAKEALRECLDTDNEAIIEAAQNALDEMKFWEDPFAI
jgi:HEAT repeat protein